MIFADDRQIRIAALDNLLRFVAIGCFAKAHDDSVAFTADAGRASAVFAAQCRTDTRGTAIEVFVDRALHIHLQQEVHAPAQIQSEIHGFCADLRKPARRIGYEIQSDNVAVAEIALQNFFRPQLRIGVAKSHFDAGRFEKNFLVTQVRSLQRSFGALQSRLVRLHRRLDRRHLHGRRFAVEVRQRIEKAGKQDPGNKDVQPDWVAVHSVEAGSRLLSIVIALAVMHLLPDIRPHSL